MRDSMEEARTSGIMRFQRLMTATDARACPIIAIPSAMAQLAHHDPLGDAEVGHLLDYLATISDPEPSAGGDIRW